MSTAAQSLNFPGWRRPTPAALPLLCALGVLCAGADRPSRPQASPIPAEKPAAAYAAATPRLVPELGEETTAYRGWPLRIRLMDTVGQPGASDLLVTAVNGSQVLKLPALTPGDWWFSPAETAQLGPGRYALAAGGVRAELAFADPPASLSRAQDAERRFALISYAMAKGDTATARREAQAWRDTAPRDPTPHVILGDLFAAQGDHANAYAAYKTAGGLASDGDHPDLGIQRKARAMFAHLFAQLPTLPPGPPVPPSPAPADLGRTAPAPGSTAPVPATNPAAPNPTVPPSRPGSPGRWQWAASARASSEYRTTDYSAARAAGAPDVPRAGDHRNAWAPKTDDAGSEWIELTYAQPTKASGVRVVQSFNPGAIAKVEVIATDGSASLVWTGPDATVYAANTVGVLEITFPAPAQPIARVKLTLDTARIRGSNAIDAVALLNGEN